MTRYKVSLLPVLSVTLASAMEAVDDRLTDEEVVVLLAEVAASFWHEASTPKMQTSIK